MAERTCCPCCGGSDRVDLADKIAASLDRKDAADTVAGRVSALRLKYLKWADVGMIDLMDAIIGNMERNEPR